MLFADRHCAVYASHIVDAVTLSEVADVLGVERSRFPSDTAFKHVSIDSRTTKPGDLFCAIPGGRVDGHDYIDSAVKAGAVAVIASRAFDAEAPVLQVPDVRVALKRLSEWYRGMLLGTVVGVTGSVGKTTTRRMIADALAARYLVTQSPKNFNNDLGVPLSLLSASAEDHFVVLELGASAVGEIRSLSNLCCPEIGVVTTIAPAHLKGFGDIAGVCQAKGELIESLPDFGVAFLNGDDENVRSLASRTTSIVKLFGTNSDCDVQATNVLASADELRFTVDGFDFSLAVVGAHHLTSALATIAVGREAGLLPTEIQEGFDTFEPTAGRCHIQRIGGAVLIDDSYNASPNSVVASARALGRFTDHPQRILVVGDMGELGENANALHFDTAKQCADRGDIDLFVAIGLFAPDWVAGFTSSGAEAVAASDQDELMAILRQRCGSSDAILLKGSRSAAMERFIPPLHEHLAAITQPKPLA